MENLARFAGYFSAGSFSISNNTASPILIPLTDLSPEGMTIPATFSGTVDVISTLSLSLTNEKPTGTYSVAPATGESFIVYGYFGTPLDPMETDAGVDIGTTTSFTKTKTSGSNSGDMFFTSETVETIPSYSELTLESGILVAPFTLAFGTDSFEVFSVPEPSTRALMMGGFALLLVWIARRNRA